MPLIKHEGSGQINAVREGVRAVHEGDPRSANPHEKGSVLFVAWDNGWSMGKDDLDEEAHFQDFRLVA